MIDEIQTSDYRDWLKNIKQRVWQAQVKSADFAPMLAKTYSRYRGVEMRLNQITDKIIQAGIEVHRTLGGPGLLETVYEEALVFELETQGLKVQRQVILPIHYKGNELGNPLRIDLLVEDSIIVECKATSENHPVFEAQLLTYLRLSGRTLGLVLNFGQKYLKDGIRRVVNGYQERGDAETQRKPE